MHTSLAPALDTPTSPVLLQVRTCLVGPVLLSNSSCFGPIWHTPGNAPPVAFEACVHIFILVMVSTPRSHFVCDVLSTRALRMMHLAVELRNSSHG
jgi:hypothetical protein